MLLGKNKLLHPENFNATTALIAPFMVHFMSLFFGHGVKVGPGPQDLGPREF